MTTKITEQNISNLANAGVDWQAVFTGDGSTGLTAVAGRGYFIDTTSSTVTVTLPASPSAGDVVVLKDYARTWGTNAVSIASAKFDGVAGQTPSFSTNGQTVTLVYMDGTKGWSLVNEDTTTGLGATFISATGGTVTTSGDYKIHTFTGDGCFVVSSVGNPAGGGSELDYLVVAGGGGGGGSVFGFYSGGGGGAGGFRESHSTPVSGCYTASPLATPTGITLSATTYPVTVGAGGTGGPGGPEGRSNGTQGSNSIFSTITSAGGGYGGRSGPGDELNGNPGGSGGGSYTCTAGSGNTPPVSPPQGNNGGNGDGPGTGPGRAGGGGGAGGAGSGSPHPAYQQPGGPGVTTSVTGSPVTYGAGGRAGGEPGGSTSDATANTGNGGMAGNQADLTGANAGKGIVILRYKYQ